MKRVPNTLDIKLGIIFSTTNPRKPMILVIAENDEAKQTWIKYLSISLKRDRLSGKISQLYHEFSGKLIFQALLLPSFQYLLQITNIEMQLQIKL